MKKYKHLNKEQKIILNKVVDYLCYKSYKLNRYILDTNNWYDNFISDYNLSKSEDVIIEEYEDFTDDLLEEAEDIKQCIYSIDLEYENFNFLLKQELFKKGYKYKEVLELIKILNIIIETENYYTGFESYFMEDTYIPKNYKIEDYHINENEHQYQIPLLTKNTENNE